MSNQDARSGHRDSETIGAFVDGTLRGEELKALSEHLLTCDECLTAVEAATRIRAELAPPSVVAPGRFRLRSRRAWILAAAVVLAVVGIPFVREELRRRSDPLAALVAATPSDHRSLQARLAGFPWAELRQYRSDDDLSPSQLKLKGAAGEALVRAERSNEPATKHAAALARLLLHQPAVAAQELAAMAERDAGNAHIHSDLAAARYALAVDGNDPTQLPLALAASDRALAIDAHLAEALFNRALILERMGLREEARVAWQDYLREDATTPWAGEARAHLSRLGVASTIDFSDRLREIGQPAKVLELVAQFPQEARAYFETEALGFWAANLEKDPSVASAHLAAARAVGAALRASNGESLLADAVAAIDAAATDKTRQMLLADAHSRYRQGRLAFRGNETAVALEMLNASAALFRRLGSPMHRQARYYEANVVFSQNRTGDARAMLEHLDREVDHTRHVALHAQVLSQLGLLYGYEGRWNEALRMLEDAAARFARLGESGYAGATESKIAETYDLIGLPGDGWSHRIKAFELLSRQRFGDRMLVTLAGAVRVELRAGRAEAARAILLLESHEASRQKNSALVADAARRMALIELRLGNRASALAAIGHAYRVTGTVKPPEMQARLTAEVQMVEAMVIRETDSGRAVEKLTSAIEFFQDSGQSFNLPQARLERGRAFLAAGLRTRALSDFQNGIAELETQRGKLPGADARSVFFDGSQALFDEAIDLLSSMGSNELAFEYAEKGRARSLLETIAVRQPFKRQELERSLPEGAAVVAYSMTDKALVTFVVSRGDFRVFRTPIERTQLRQTIEALGRLLRDHGDLASIRARTSALHELLMGNRLPAGASTLVVVPDRELQMVPWASLLDRQSNRYLVEDFTIWVAPSAAVWMQTGGSPTGAAELAALLIGSSGGSQSRTIGLGAIDEELTAIAATFPGSRVLRGEDATRTQFLRYCAEAELVHFAGHARAARGMARDAALLFAPTDAADHGEITERDLERLKLPRTRLVVLAACDTLRGDSSGLEGTPSLARAFLATGVPAVVGALWRIEDSVAARLFSDFYRNLNATEGPAQALRSAQLSMIRSEAPEVQHPSSWGGVQVLGRQSTRP